MARLLVITAASLLWLGAMVPSQAQACGKDEGASCPCGHGKAAKAGTTANTSKTAAEKADQKAEPKAATPDAKTPEKKPEASSEQRSSLLKDVDVLIADKCDCDSAADCTCKKGQCKCSKCKPKRMIQPVKGTQDALRLPAGGRGDASSGVFI